MKSDVKEVLAVPAGESFQCVKNNSIHACSASYSYKPARYMTFRQKGGEMETLYRVEALFEMNPYDRNAIERISPKYSERVKNYIDDRMRIWPFQGSAKRRFYVLSETDRIELKHKPRLLRNIQGHCYFTLDELRSGKKVVQVASKQS